MPFDAQKTTIVVSRREVEDLRKRMEKILSEQYGRPYKIRTNEELWHLLSRFFIYWFENVPPKTAMELHDIVEQLAYLKRVDRRAYDGVRGKFRRILQGIMEVFADADEIIAEMFGETVEEYAEEEVE